MTTTKTRSKRGRLALAAAAAALLAGGGAARAGFPTFDVAAFGQRVQQAISSNAQVASLASLVTQASTMVTTLDSQLSQALQAAEGQIGALANWGQMFPTSEVLGTAAQVQGWIGRAGTLRDRAGRVASGALAALPAEADFRAAWAAAPPTTPIGTPVLPPAAASRADIAARAAQARAAVFGRLDEIASQRALAAERHAGLLEDVRQRLVGIAGDTEASSTALQQKQLSAAAAGADMQAAMLQLQALREELAIEEPRPAPTASTCRSRRSRTCAATRWGTCARCGRGWSGCMSGGAGSRTSRRWTGCRGWSWPGPTTGSRRASPARPAGGQASADLGLADRLLAAARRQCVAWLPRAWRPGKRWPALFPWRRSNIEAVHDTVPREGMCRRTGHPGRLLSDSVPPSAVVALAASVLSASRPLGPGAAQACAKALRADRSVSGLQWSLESP